MKKKKKDSPREDGGFTIPWLLRYIPSKNDVTTVVFMYGLEASVVVRDGWS